MKFEFHGKSYALVKQTAGERDGDDTCGGCVFICGMECCMPPGVTTEVDLACTTFSEERKIDKVWKEISQE